MSSRSKHFRAALLSASALVSAAALSAASPVAAQTRQVAFDMPAQPLTMALKAYGATADQQLIFSERLVQGRTAPALKGEYAPDQALAMLLAGSGLTAERTPGGVVTIRSADTSPQSGSAAGDGAEVEALIVTAQKREEDIQDVPIAISAFTQEALETHQIAGGPDLMTQIPNFTFTKTNFSSYSIQIRGIGTQAISATVDPAVAIAFNNTPFIRNRFFEQEFYDLNRIEVLRGPQGTLYGRNATAGVVNLLTARPKHVFEAKLSADVSNYSSRRLEGMVNLPLVEDRVALRLAGAWTRRDGYVTNEITGDQIDGRDLWSARATLAIEPTDAVRAYITYEHFEEDDDRLRSGKQLCKRGENFAGGDDGGGVFGAATYTTQGCVMASLYSEESFQVPNGFGLPYWGPIAAIGQPIRENIDPYASTTQSQDLRVISSELTPVYQAKTDTVHVSLEVDINDDLTFTSETGYNVDELFSFQDFNRFNTSPGVFDPTDGIGGSAWVERNILSAEGVFCDPQLGCADRLVAADVSTARSAQFSQEVRVSSDFDGPFNFHLGANYLRYDTLDKYYVFINALTLFTTWSGNSNDHVYLPGITDNSHCLFNFMTINANNPEFNGCYYIDPNPIGSLDDNGRNYFLSKNPFRLISYAVFGEAVYNITPDLKLTAGFRYTVDQKHAPLVPSWLLTGGYGTPAKEIREQEWREPTGRLVLDWQPDLAFTDETLIYGSYAHGYKAGGTNPPLPGGLPLGTVYQGDTVSDRIQLLQPPEFGPEFIDAFELGTKNTLLDGRLTLNANLFHYVYDGYQISQIVNRSAVNLNFDAKVWGAELEADWRPLENLKISFKGGWEKTRVDEGQGAIDMIDRTAGNEDWLVVKPFPTNPSNCVLPRWLIEDYGYDQFYSSGGGACNFAYILGIDPITQLPYVPDPTVQSGSGPVPAGYPGFDPTTAPNNGQGFEKDLGGNELPNAPDFTATLSIDYTLPLPHDWLLTFHTDLYRQSEAWTRIYNADPYDRLKPYVNVNLAAILVNEDAGWKMMAYVKNVMDTDSITGAFLNSDDTGLTTNVFLTEPRLYGLRVTKSWTGEPWWNVGGGEGDLPLTVEIGGMVQRHDAPNEAASPPFVDEFSTGLQDAFAAQEEDLDWGDGREVSISYAPASSDWRASLGARFGRTNGSSSMENVEQLVGSWLTFIDTPVFEPICDDVGDIQCYVPHPGNYAQGNARDLEEHVLIDFQVGREFGLGGFGSSTFSGGIRYADLKSISELEMRGTPDYTFPPELLLFPTNRVHLTRFEATLDAERSFQGFGPFLEWDASRALLGNGETGFVDLDLTLTGGMLFGKQETSVTSEEKASYYNFSWGVLGPTVTQQRGAPVPASSYDNLPVSVRRRDEASVPFGGAELGLSYQLGRVKVSTGYRWERFFDALDGGNEEAVQVDRTIDGPYFKLRFGFGG